MKRFSFFILAAASGFLTMAAFGAPRVVSKTDLAEVPGFGLHDHLGRFHWMRYYENDPETRAFVLIIHANGCPIVRKRIPEINRLVAEYAPRGVHFWMLNASPQDDRAEVAREAAEFELKLPVLMDTTQLVAESLGVHRTSEAFLIDPKTWKVVYRGAIDDRLDYESAKPRAGQRHLADALDAVLAGQPVKKTRTDTPGCLVTFEGADKKTSASISYAQTIAPLLQRKCVDCHSDGGIGPFAMSSYRKVKGWSKMIEEVLLTGRMVPWQADPYHGEFANDFSLTTGEQRQLVRWIRAGAPRGSGPDPLEGYTPRRVEWALGTPDHIVNIGEQSIPAEGVIDYRYIYIESPFDRDVWVRAVDVRPGNTRVLHHVIAWSIARENGQEKERWLAGYAPGMQPEQFPEGTAVLLPKGSTMKFQMHYTASGKPETDATRLGLYLAPEPPRKELQTGVIMNTKIKIAPHARDHQESKSLRVSRDALLFSMNPHMHYRGKAMSYEAQYPDGTKEILLSVPRYHFNWQRSYELKEPKRLPKGTRLTVHATWDNSSLNHDNPDPNREVPWGEQSFDEMLFASFQFIDADPIPPETAALRPPAGSNEQP